MKELFKEIIKDAEMNTGYEIACMGNKTPERLLFLINILYILFWMVKVTVLEKTCKRKGHDWIDESYGGPDSGAMAGTCKRCGYSFHTQLY